MKDGREILSSVISSQIDLHRPFGGVVPELASREHLEKIEPIVKESLERAKIEFRDLDAVAVTQGPGLIGSLLVGVCYAKALAFGLDVPLIGVNHIEGHVFSVIFENPEVEYPALALVVSGGHTNLFFVPEPGKYKVVSRTRDDAAGEAFDKVAKMLGLEYPGGPVIERIALEGDPKKIKFTRAKISDGRPDFSFSGLKTAVLRYVREHRIDPLPEGEAPTATIINLVTSFQDKVIRSLLVRVRAAVRRHRPRTIILAGGVACNSALRATLKAEEFDAPVYYPSPILTTDNAAMIAAAGYPKLLSGEDHGLGITASTSIRLDNLKLAGYEVPAKARYRI